MRRLLSLYKELPPEMRMLLAMAGLGAPAGVIYFLSKQFGWPVHTIIFGLIVLVAVSALASYVISKLFSRGAARRSRRLETELARGSESGPVSMDLGAAVKANNEKFFTAIRDMRKNLRVSVYDLPWFIVIGDSGCGKTKLVNEGGLTFSSGKPEGYQLGTLNYNWWFTEDAVFVDMAGRLCNPQDDADRREWLSFLDTIAKGRKGFPINGALVCISAEHLMQDPPEKHEQDANTALERLRDLQSRLGVTFATHLVVTKCDKILGFMQFFDRAERDITLKNQIFGWSRPGSFNELYDPEGFDKDFDDMYARLNELRLRRLNDDADEIELGLAYSFPEEHRRLREPLQTYIRTLFPMIRNPRAVKNLIFRGVYFTSATQQGEVILRHLVERLGAEAAGSFAPLESLYPQPRPHFVKDLLFRKVFPEYGLVFRNEQQVIRNRRLSRLLKVGSVAMAVVLFGALGLSFYQFRETIGTASAMFRESDSGSQAVLPATVSSPATALAASGQVAQAVTQLERKQFWANVLSLGIGARAPIRNLDSIRLNLFHKRVLPDILKEVSETLAARDPAEFAGQASSPALAGVQPGSLHPNPIPNRYTDALVEYVRWQGAAARQEKDQWPGADSFRRLSAVLSQSDTARTSLWGEDGQSGEAGAYFSRIAARSDWKHNPAAWMTGGGFNSEGTIRRAITRVHDYLEPYARLDRYTDAALQEWMRIHRCCAEVEDSYSRILGLRTADIIDLAGFAQFKNAFVSHYHPQEQDEQVHGFVRAIDGCRWTLKADPPPYVRIKEIRPLLQELRKLWTSYQDNLTTAYRPVATPAGGRDAVIDMIVALGEGRGPAELRGLNPLLWDSLKGKTLINPDFENLPYKQEYFLDRQLFENIVQDVHARYRHIITLKPDPAASDQLLLTTDASTVASTLQGIQNNLASAKTDSRPDLTQETMEGWIREFKRLNPVAADAAVAGGGADAIALASGREWSQTGLSRLDAEHRILIARAEGTQLLRTIDARLDLMGDWGLAELVPGRCAHVSSPYSSLIADCPDAGRAQPIRPQQPVEQPTALERRRTQQAPARDQPPPPQQLVGAGEDKQIPQSMTYAFWHSLADAADQLLGELDAFDGSRYFSDGDRPLTSLCTDKVEKAAARYVQSYVAAWNAAYARQVPRLEADLRRLRPSDGGWKSLAAQFERTDTARTIAHEFAPAVEKILRCTRWLLYGADGSRLLPRENICAMHFEAAVGDAALWNNGRFAYHDVSLMPPGGGEPAWAAARNSLNQAWMDLCNALAGNAAPDRQMTAGAGLKPIPWGTIQKLRGDYGLPDEKLTQQLVEFERFAQVQLSREVTLILCGIQNQLDASRPQPGWPYLARGHDALETVDFEKFKTFLLNVRKAREAFSSFERHLGTQPPEDRLGWEERDRFYRQCENWLTFLDLKDGIPQRLAIEVYTADPLAPPFGKEKVDDTPQHYYQNVELYLGLESGEAGQGGRPAAVVIPATASGAPTNTRWWWNWTPLAGQDQLSLRFVGGIAPVWATQPAPDIPARTFGNRSPLAFCAYLQQHGNEDQGRWVVSHAVDIAQAFRNAGVPQLIPPNGKNMVGMKFLFRLDRPLPEPIRPLELPAGVGRLQATGGAE